MAMLMAQRFTERSHSEGTIRIGIPMAIMRPCFQSMLLTRVLLDTGATAALTSSDIAFTPFLPFPHMPTRIDSRNGNLDMLSHFVYKNLVTFVKIFKYSNSRIKHIHRNY